MKPPIKFVPIGHPENILEFVCRCFSSERRNQISASGRKGGSVVKFTNLNQEHDKTMFPTKSMVDYMTEMNRLFPRPETENAYSLAAQSPYNSTINRSSSSTDSTSPDSFPEISMFQSNANARKTPDPRPIYETPPSKLNPQRMCDTPKASDTPFQIRRQRPIVGRKILANETPKFERVQVSPIAKIPEEDFMLWQEEPVLFQHTPPNVNNIFINHTNVYELFPENKPYELQTPVKTSPTPSSTLSNVLSNLSSISPNKSSMASTPCHTPIPMFRQRSPSVHSTRPGSSRYYEGPKMCTFCRKNGETPVVYMTHFVKERVGNTFIVSCPILRSHVCSTCGATGDDAHTISYCPVLRSSNNGFPLQSTTITLKNTRIMSNGRRRF